jgi:TrmH family RNA methyltransferase
MGTILRLADWFGVQQIFCSYDCVDCYNPKVVQASMGAIFRIKCYYYDLNSLLKQKSVDGVNIYGATLEGENLYRASFKLPAIILMGNESVGISEMNKRHLTKEFLIPNFSINPLKSESLNVSTATSVILGEFRRQQYYSK